MNHVERVIADFRNDALIPGHCGERELMTPAELAFSGMWSALCDELVVMEDRFGWAHPVVHHLRTRMRQIADARPDAVSIFALNTSRYGREDEHRNGGPA